MGHQWTHTFYAKTPLCIIKFCNTAITSRSYHLCRSPLLLLLTQHKPVSCLQQLAFVFKQDVKGGGDHSDRSLPVMRGLNMFDNFLCGFPVFLLGFLAWRVVWPVLEMLVAKPSLVVKYNPSFKEMLFKGMIRILTELLANNVVPMIFGSNYFVQKPNGSIWNIQRFRYKFLRIE